MLVGDSQHTQGCAWGLTWVPWEPVREVVPDPEPEVRGGFLWDVWYGARMTYGERKMWKNIHRIDRIMRISKDGSQRERLLWFPSSEIYLAWGDCWFLGGHENSEDREPAWGQSMWGLTNYIKKVRHWEDKTLWRIFKKRGTGISVCLSFLLWVCMDEDWGGTMDMSQNIPKVDDYLI